jgi:hypothetical protein
MGSHLSSTPPFAAASPMRPAFRDSRAVPGGTARQELSFDGPVAWAAPKFHLVVVLAYNQRRGSGRIALAGAYISEGDGCAISAGAEFAGVDQREGHSNWGSGGRARGERGV